VASFCSVKKTTSRPISTMAARIAAEDGEEFGSRSAVGNSGIEGLAGILLLAPLKLPGPSDARWREQGRGLLRTDAPFARGFDEWLGYQRFEKPRNGCAGTSNIWAG